MISERKSNRQHGYLAAWHCANFIDSFVVGYIYIFCDHRLLFRQELRNKEAGIEGRSRTDKNDHKMKRDK